MTKVEPDSQLDPVLHRRRQLRSQRRFKLVQSFWRTLALISLAAGLSRVASLIDWHLDQPAQVLIKGNRLLATSAIRSLIPLSLPQSLIYLRPELITQTLTAKAPLDQATVTRQLFPPRLVISVQERQPVAIAAVCNDQNVKSLSCRLQPPVKPVQQDRVKIWLLDSHGILMPLESYPTLRQSKLPQLTVWGVLETEDDRRQTAQEPASATQKVEFNPGNSISWNQRKKSQWPYLYEALRRSPVKVFEVNWQDETNLILKTELGTVQLGAYSSKLTSQLAALAQLHNLPQQFKQGRIAYIDLKNPKNPLLQMNKPK